MAGAGIDLRRGGTVALALAIAGAWGLGAASLTAAQPYRLHQSAGAESGRRAEPPPVGRYEADPGSAFVFDRTQGPPLLRFENSPEIWVLRAVSGPRGDVIYKNDIGRPLLRATKVGGMTVFTLENPGGMAAAFSGPVLPFRVLTPIGPATLFQRVLATSLRASRAAQHFIRFDVPTGTPESAALMADAALVASEVMVRLMATPDGRRVAARVDRILVVEGARPAAALRNGVLQITVTSSLGMNGRLSSDRILAIVMH